VCFPPYQEDYGLVTVEAFTSGKAVVTCLDSGGPAELVEDGRHGFVCDPSPAAVANAIGVMMNDRQRAIAMGEAARARAKALSWPNTIERLLACQ